MDIREFIDQVIEDQSFRNNVIEFLLGLCAIDTSTGREFQAVREGEARILGLIKDELKRLSLPNSMVVAKPISPDITGHISFTPTPHMRNGGDIGAAYTGRYNLLYLLDNPPSAGGRGTALNVHVDTVPPHTPPELRNDTVFGRGCADDKGNIAALLGSLHIIRELRIRRAVTLKNAITVMFVIDEEMGGNGSLDLALDRELKARYESLLVLECTDNRIHPANRGAVFFECRVRGQNRDGTHRGAGVPVLEALLFAVCALLEEGESIKAESDHALFPHRPVQTCTGILGPFGEHPSTICGMVRCRITGIAHEEVKQRVEAGIHRGVHRYTERYGDKTGVLDRVTGKKKLDRHFDVDSARAGDNSLVLTVYGCTGHMGSLPANDAAIAKLAFIGEELIREKQSHGLNFRIEPASGTVSDTISFEGAQGFLPTHPLAEIELRLRKAFNRGLERYLNQFGYDPGSIRRVMAFQKLHNEAYECDPESDTVKRAMRAAALSGLLQRSVPVVGWDVSCDARLFANEYPDLPVLTFGAGKLEYAHGNEERVALSDVFDAVRCITLFLLLETGSVC